MRTHFHKYPNKWGLKKNDTNIDHRRVTNLMVFFTPKGVVLPITNKAEEYKPGNIVCWYLGGGVAHIGLVIHLKSMDGKHPLIVHNMGAGQVQQDCLFSYKIIGHYRYEG